jgi:hypothetical protein
VDSELMATYVLFSGDELDVSFDSALDDGKMPALNIGSFRVLAVNEKAMRRFLKQLHDVLHEEIRDGLRAAVARTK